MSRSLGVFVWCLLASTPAVLLCQAPPDLGKGLTPFTIYNSTAIDNVNMTNGNVYVHIPLLSYPQRGKALHLSFSIFANARVWGCGIASNDGITVGQGTGCVWAMNSSLFDASVGGTVGAVVASDQGGEVSSNLGYVGCNSTGSGPYAGCAPYVFENWAYHSPDGGVHYFYSGPVNNGLLPGYTYGGYPATDGSGYSNASSESNGSVVDRNGVSIGDYRSDADGNQIAFPLNDGPYTDTLNRTIPDPIFGSVSVATSNCPASALADSAKQWKVPGPSTANGGQESYYLCYRTLMPSPEFPGHAYILPNGVPVGLVALVLPDQTYFQFGYNNFLELTQIKLPTGGMVNYVFTDVPLGNDLNQARVLASRTTSDGVNAPATTNYTWLWNQSINNAPGTITIQTDPLGNDEVHFNGFTVGQDNGSARSANDIKTDSYQGCSTYKGTGCIGTGQLLKSVSRVYQTLSNQTSTMLVAAGGPATTQSRILSETTTLPSSTGTTLVSQKVYTYVPPQVTFLWYNLGPGDQSQTCFQCGEFNQIRSVAEFDYGNGSPGSLLKTTTTHYKWEDQTPLGNSTVGAQYLSANLVDLPMYVQVVGTGLTEETDYYYDETTPMATSGLGQNSGVLGPIRGQLTSVSRSHNGAGTQGKLPKNSLDPTTTTVWYDTGVPYQTVDPNGNPPTTYTYDPAYAGAYVTKTVDSTGNSVSAKYDYNTGAMTSFTDVDSATTTYTYDSVVRPLSVLYPDGGQHDITYNVTSTPGNVVVQDSIDSNRFDEHTIVYDGFGREIETQHNTDTPSTSYVDTSYDQNGHPWMVTNPYRSKSNPFSETTYGVTKTYYDALGRETSRVLSDGTSTTSTTYSGMPYTWQGGNTTYYGLSKAYTDSRGNKTIWASDALGHLGATVENSAGAGNLSALTTVYVYDGFNLRNVEQQGDGTSSSAFRNRTFGYDALSRLTYSFNPEAGAISYAYDLNSNLKTKTAARNTVITYNYDALNRLTSKTYASDPAHTPSSCYQYGTTAGYSLERLTMEWTEPPSASPCVASSNALTSRTFSTYDSRGRIVNEQQCVVKSCSQNVPGTNTYSYDLAGHLLNFGNLAGTGLFTNGYDSAGRLSSISESWSAPNTGSQFPSTLFSGTTYAPHGALAAATYGTNLTIMRTYDSRLRIFGEIDSGTTVQQPAHGSSGSLTITGGVQSK